MRHACLFALMTALTLWTVGCDQEPASDAENDLAAADTAAVASETYYLAPDGSDENAGTSAGQPWQTFGHALPQLAPGDSLVLLDGTYTPEQNGRFFADGFDGARSGTEAAPITVKAQNERQAYVKSDGRDAAILLQNLQWWYLEGLRASNQDNPEATKGGEGLKLINTRHMTIRRGLFHNNNRYRNAQMLMIVLSRDVLVEESEIYNFHRNGFESYRSEDVTFRRCYANSRGHADLPDGASSHGISQDGGDRAFVGYYTSNLLVENSISEDRTEGFGFISGLPTNVVEPDSLAADPPVELEGYPDAYYSRIQEDEPRVSGNRARFLGIISLRDNMGGAVQSRDPVESSRPIRDVRLENVVMADFIHQGFTSRAAHDLTMHNVTSLGGDDQGRWDGQSFSTNLSRQRYWPPCEEVGGCTYQLTGWLIANNAGPALGSLPSNADSADFRMSYANFYNNEGGVGVDEDISDSEGQVRQSMQEQPTGVGLEEGQCLVYVPERSNMSGAGEGGADIGANILYRYEDGELTDEPLWDPETGAFPHGAVIDSLNGVAGNSAFDVHKRLNVNTEGCPLPYGNVSENL